MNTIILEFQIWITEVRISDFLLYTYTRILQTILLVSLYIRPGKLDLYQRLLPLRPTASTVIIAF